MQGLALAVLPAFLVGGLLERLGIPLGWLLGAALATGFIAILDLERFQVSIPKPVYNLALIVLGCQVGLAVTEEVGGLLLRWAPVMVLVALIGIGSAAMLAPFLSRFGRISAATAFFSLLPGGVIEMSSIGAKHGAERETIAALHTLRLGLVVSLIPLGLLSFWSVETPQAEQMVNFALLPMSSALVVGFIGSFIASRLSLPAAWLLGAVVLVGLGASTGLVSASLPTALLAIAQVLAGIGLGTKFRRKRLAILPRALIFGLPSLLFLMGLMVLMAMMVAPMTAQDRPTLILCFSIGGMAEMVLTAKALGQNAALVAGFQVVRGVIVNACSGLFWTRLRILPLYSDQK